MVCVCARCGGSFILGFLSERECKHRPLAELHQPQRLEPQAQSSSWHRVTVKVILGSTRGERQENVCVTAAEASIGVAGG